MAFPLSTLVRRQNLRFLEEKLSLLTLTSVTNSQQKRNARFAKPKLRHPTWFTKSNRVVHNDQVTRENQEFLREVVDDRYVNNAPPAPEIEATGEWEPSLQRTGVIARKIGVYPMWLKSGKRIQTTLLQVLDNHVIRYYCPEEYDPPRKRRTRIFNKKGCLLLGAEAADPSTLTKEYCGLFKNSGVVPKQILGRFFVSPDAALPTGTLITAMHFTVGNYVDVRGKTIDRGFQGVVKRHGFKGMPASHGVTKTHRRPGNIGGGGEKGRVWPGTKLPGHMGNRVRTTKALKIWRINTKYNVLWVSGCAIPGSVNSICYVFDTILRKKKPLQNVAFPTYVANDETLPEDIFDEEVHRFDEPTIVTQDS